MDLKDYIEHVKDLEISCYKQECYLQELNRILQTAERPKLNEYIVPGKSSKAVSVAGWIGLIAGGLIGGVILGYIAQFFVSKAAMATVFCVFAVLGVILAVVYGIWESIAQGRRNKEIENENFKIAIENSAIMAQVPQRTHAIKKEIEHAKRVYDEIWHVRYEYYAKNIIFEKYRSLVPVCMFYEYLASGRCTQLEGHEGAYNLYESEARMQVIITKLNDIIERLDRIENNQYSIAVAIRQSQQEINKLSSAVQQQVVALKNIENNTDVSAYYNGITAMNTSYLAWLAYLDR